MQMNVLPHLSSTIKCRRSWELNCVVFSFLLKFEPSLLSMTDVTIWDRSRWNWILSNFLKSHRGANGKQKVRHDAYLDPFLLKRHRISVSNPLPGDEIQSQKSFPMRNKLVASCVDGIHKHVYLSHQSGHFSISVLEERANYLIWDRIECFRWKKVQLHKARCFTQTTHNCMKVVQNKLKHDNTLTHTINSNNLYLALLHVDCRVLLFLQVY